MLLMKGVRARFDFARIVALCAVSHKGLNTFKTYAKRRCAVIDYLISNLNLISGERLQRLIGNLRVLIESWQLGEHCQLTKVEFG